MNTSTVIIAAVMLLTGCTTTGFGTYAWKENVDGKISIIKSSSDKYDFEAVITDINGYSWDNSLRQERDIMVATWSNGQCKVVDERRENFVDAGSVLVSAVYARGYAQHRYVAGIVCNDTFSTDTKVLVIQ